MSKAASSGGNNLPPIPTNRFQKSGSDAVYEVKETKNAFVMRVDMPGCPDSDLVYWVEGSNIHFFAYESALPGYNHDGRKFGGSIVIDPEYYDVKETKARLLNGVLWIIVPKFPGKNAKIGVIEKMLNLQMTRNAWFDESYPT